MGDRESESVALVAPPPKLKAAESLATQKRGEVAMLDKKGRVISRSKLRRNAILIYSYLGALSIYLISVGAWSGVVVGGAMWGAFVLLLRRRGLVYREVTPLLSAYRADEATARLAALEPSCRRGMRRIAWLAAAADAAWQRGDHAAADQHLTALLAAIGASRRGWNRVQHQMTALTHAMLLWVLGDTQRAEAATAALPAAEPGTWAHQRMKLIQLLRAFHLDDAAQLPDDATLLDWAREALAREWIVADLALLAWAFERRGDAETSRWLLDEAPSRMQAPPEVFARMYPRLAAWVAERPGAPA